MAKALDWFEGSALRDDFKAKFLCAQYRRLTMEYDLVWLAPQAVLVSADPMTVVKDPNPTTCDLLAPPAPAVPKSPSRGADIDKFTFPSREATPVKQYAECGVRAEPIAEEDEDCNLEAAPIKSCAGGDSKDAPVMEENGELTPDTKDSAEVQQPQLAQSISRPSVAMSMGLNVSMMATASSDEDARTAHTLSKCYNVVLDQALSRKLVPCEDFITMCLNNNVGLITRVNLSKELKSIGGSYPPELVEKHGIRHQDVLVMDFDGGVPEKKDFRQMLASARRLDGNKAVLVHCKGGFGRSVLMACVYLVDRFDVPGSALLGWARIVRPGAITTVDQEVFLSKLRGADDLAKALGTGTCPCKFW